MKTIYFVRHGETSGNSGPLTQNETEPLNENGISQANIIADRLCNLKFDLLVASPLARAQQTAKIISEKTNKDIVTNDFFVEYRRPSEQLGLRKDDPIVIKSVKSYYEALRTGLKYKDGESFEEMHTRAKKCLEYLENLSEDKIVVVTHGVFMKVLCAAILMEDVISPPVMNKFTKNMLTTNTGITIFEYNNNWSLKVWNDSAHFAEY